MAAEHPDFWAVVLKVRPVVSSETTSKYQQAMTAWVAHERTEVVRHLFLRPVSHVL